MSIDYLENYTKVMTPEGEGRLVVTRRERTLISEDKLHIVEVRLKDNIINTFNVADVTEILPEEPEQPSIGNKIEYLMARQELLEIAFIESNTTLLTHINPKQSQYDLAIKLSQNLNQLHSEAKSKGII